MGDRGRFDVFAAWASGVVSRAPFFASCVLLVVIWVPTLFLLDINTSQLLINTATTIITFLLVALLQNSQARSEKADNAKLNAVADGLADLMVYVAISTQRRGNPGREEGGPKLDPDRLLRDAEELRRSVGLEDRVGA